MEKGSPLGFLEATFLPFPPFLLPSLFFSSPWCSVDTCVASSLWCRTNSNCGSPPSLPAPSVFCVVATSVSLSLLPSVAFLCFPPRPLVCSLCCGSCGGCLPLVPLFAAAITVSPLSPCVADAPHPPSFFCGGLSFLSPFPVDKVMP